MEVRFKSHVAEKCLAICLEEKHNDLDLFDKEIDESEIHVMYQT